MTNADRMRDDQLNDLLDALVAGENSGIRQIDPATTGAARLFFGSDDTPAPPRDLDAQIWEELMDQNALAGSIPLRPSLAPPGLNGGKVSRPWQRGPVAKTASHRLGRPGFVRLAIAAILLLSLGFGYLAFEPFRADPKQPEKLPAAVAPAATPTTQLFPRTDHPIIGVWKVDVDPANPSVIWYPTFAEDGTYVMYDHDRIAQPTVSIGTWRATSEHSVELVFIMQPIVPQDMFDPNRVLEGTKLQAEMSIWRVTLTLDETGKTMTSVGGYEAFDDQGTKVYSDGPWEMKWTQMIVDPTAPIPTPTP